MKKIILTFIFFLSCLSIHAQSARRDYVLKAQLINFDQGAGCGYLKLATVLDFKVISFSDKDYRLENVGIIIRCPELYGDEFFVIGKVYDLIIEVEEENESTDYQFNYSVQNMKNLEKYHFHKIYWAVSVSLEN